MSATYQIEIDGFEFAINVGTYADGVVVNADHRLITHTEDFQSTLNEAIDRVPFYYAKGYLENYTSGQSLESIQKDVKKGGMMFHYTEEVTTQYARAVRGEMLGYFELSEKEHIFGSLYTEFHEKRIAKAAKIKEEEPGYIYVITAGNGLSKIGLTRSTPEQRLKSLQTGAPSELVLAFSVCVDRPNYEEGNLHDRYASKRSHGEWFELTPNDIIDIRQLYESKKP